MTRRTSVMLSAAKQGMLVAALTTVFAAPSAHGQEQPTPEPARMPRAVFRARAVDTLGSRAATPAALDTATSDFDVGGVHVILRRNTATDVVAANVYLLGGTQQVTPATAGIEPLLLAAAERGTKRYSTEAMRRAMTRTGAQVTIEPTADWTLYGLRTLRDALDSAWAPFADRLVAPTLDSAAIEQVREQMLAAVENRHADPDALVEQVADSIAFGAHPYALDPDGSERSLSGITRAQLRQYHDAQLVTSRMLVVFVGNVDRKHVERLVRATLATLPAGSYRWTPPPVPATQGARVALVPRQLPTNYILGYYAGPSARSPDYAALRVASAVLAGSLFSEIRSRRNLTYAVDAPFLERAVATGGVYVTTVAPDTTLALMKNELGMLQTELLDDLALKRLVQRFITDYFLKNETNGDQANFLARSALYEGDWRAASRFVESLRRVTPEDVQRVARTYMKDFRFAYVGDVNAVKRSSLESF